MPEYTIQAIAPQVREFESKFGKMRSYKVKFATDPDAIEVTQKESSPAPYEGQVLTGDIVQGQYGKKFKKDYGGSFGGGSPTSSQTAGTPSSTTSSYQPRDDSHIKAQWAIGQAMTWSASVNTDGKLKLESVEKLATKLFEMVDRVKEPRAAEPEVATVTGNEKVDELFPDVETVDTGELPWNPAS